MCAVHISGRYIYPMNHDTLMSKHNPALRAVAYPVSTLRCLNSFQGLGKFRPVIHYVDGTAFLFE